MGNFEKLSVLVIVVIIVMILVVALYTLTEDPEDNPAASSTSSTEFETDEWQEPVEDDVPPAGDETENDLEKPEGTEPPPSEPEEDIEKKETIADANEPADADDAALKEWWYTVKSGDTLGQIAMDHLGSMRRYPEIIRMNPGVTAMNLQIGQKLKMPAKGAKKAAGPEFRPLGGAKAVATGGAGGPTPGTHYVTKSGDQLQRISKLAYGTIERWPEIYAKNLAKIDNPDIIPAGIRIFLPE